MKALESVREGMLKNIYAVARPAVTGDFPCLWMAIVPKEERKPCKWKKERTLCSFVLCWTHGSADLEQPWAEGRKQPFVSA